DRPRVGSSISRCRIPTFPVPAAVLRRFAFDRRRSAWACGPRGRLSSTLAIHLLLWLWPIESPIVGGLQGVVRLPPGSHPGPATSRLSSAAVATHQSFASLRPRFPCRLL